MTSAAILRRIVRALDTAGIPFSFAAAYHGAPRATRDIDLVILPTELQLRALVAVLTDAGQHVSAEVALNALRSEGLFNVIDPVSGWKIDLICRKARPFSREEFSRRIQVDFDDLPLAVASVEDVILSKLEWASLGGSARQLEDVAELLRVHKDRLDEAYLRRWMAALNVRPKWETALQASKSP